MVINNINAISVECYIQDNVWVPFGYLKECLAYNVVSKEPGQKLTSVDSYRDLAELESFYIYQSPSCYFLPAGITNKFQNLKTLIVAHTGLASLTKEDLAPFSNLLGLYIDFNKITSISGDLFINNKNLQQLSLQQNGITYVEPDSFKLLTKLTLLDFNGNPCHSGKANGRDNVQDFIIDIERNCNVREFVESLVESEIKSSMQDQNELGSGSDENNESIF